VANCVAGPGEALIISSGCQLPFKGSVGMAHESHIKNGYCKNGGKNRLLWRKILTTGGKSLLPRFH